MEKSKQVDKENTKVTKPRATKPAVGRVTNPMADKGIVARINNFNTQKTNNKLYSGYLSNTMTPKTLDFIGFVSDLNKLLVGKNTAADLFSALHSVFTEKMNCAYTAFGIFHEKSNCINLKLQNKLGSTYSSKIFMSDDFNPVVESFRTSSIVTRDDNKFLNIPYLQESTTFILPLISVNQCLDVMILGMNVSESETSLLSFVANI